MFSSVALSSRDLQQQQLQALTASTRFALRIARLQLGETLRDGSIFWRLSGVPTLISDSRCRDFSVDRFGLMVGLDYQSLSC